MSDARRWSAQPVYVQIPGLPGRWATTGCACIRDDLELRPEWKTVTIGKPATPWVVIEDGDLPVLAATLAGDEPVDRLTRFAIHFGSLLRLGAPDQRFASAGYDGYPWFRMMVIRLGGEPVASVAPLRRMSEGSLDPWGNRDLDFHRSDQLRTERAREIDLLRTVQPALDGWAALPAPR